MFFKSIFGSSEESVGNCYALQKLAEPIRWAVLSGFVRELFGIDITEPIQRSCHSERMRGISGLPTQLEILRVAQDDSRGISYPQILLTSLNKIYQTMLLHSNFFMLF